MPASASKLTPILVSLFALSTSAANASPVAASTVNCTTAACGLYLGLSGSVSAGTNYTFSYQPTWVSTNSRSVSDGAQLGPATNGASAAVSVSDFITFGALKSDLSSRAQGGTPGTVAPYPSASTDSYIAFGDRLTFTGQPDGTFGTMIGRLAFSGSVSASASTTVNPLAYGYAQAQADVSGATGFVTAKVFDRSDDALGSIYIDPSNPNYLLFSLSIKFGAIDFTQLYVRLWTSVSSNALTNQWAQSDADFFSSLEWDGIEKVMDANGNTLTNWQVSSASGFDYTRSYADQLPQTVNVPEPTSLALFALGLIGLTAARRKLAQH